ncbi:bile acid:sodium symporter family protein [Gordonia alkanivorans]|uniref:bile acid:sodium symporter family protein n=1 Tax=Gordonia alkanivorans TaxID=84096 RepID=UPI00244CFFE4|nr:bile acid:sodium symporter family protein [Gordonia alkanivorans]MDH3006163.1 bile acid:sodium symporter [Gordonia alkanivorans]MDH3015918.1 bile acid:sodium symporter [Gordonia alkanivorans]MDH3040578.1 bile acid:sodium symporter [Gordonia alkanivorans]MDJ0028914.1 bile acid:sodium symporter family protein [Gordonia alkanivorans]
MRTLKNLLDRSPIDGFILAIVAAVVVAAFLPLRGAAGEVLDWVVVIAIGALFFLYGTRLHPREALEGLKHWRLHVTILAFTFVAFPIIGLALKPVVEPLVGSDLYAGLLFLCLVPSTVQSSIAFTSIAKGNIAGAIVSASASNILGVFLTPLLVVALMNNTGGASIDASSILKIVAQILVPFVVGQLARPWVGLFFARHAKITKLADRSTIVLVVYVAFSEGVVDGIWSSVDAGQVIAVSVISLVLVVVMLAITGWLPKKLGFDRADTIAIQFCGTKKSLATGLPMATVLFAGSTVGLIVLPLMIFHQIQLIICSWLATRYGREAEAVDAG